MFLGTKIAKGDEHEDDYYMYNQKKEGHTVWICPSFGRLIRLIVDGTADNIKQLAGDGLLTTLVVLQVQLAKQLVGIIRRSLHGHHSGGML